MANRDDLVLHLKVKTKITGITTPAGQPADELVAVIECGLHLVARCYGDGEPRALPKTQSPRAHEARKVAEAQRSKAVAGGGPRAA